METEEKFFRLTRLRFRSGWLTEQNKIQKLQSTNLITDTIETLTGLSQCSL